MMLFIPDVGDQIKLDADWQFKLQCEHRNISLLDAFEIPEDQRDYANRWGNAQPKFFDMMLPAGTVLKIDRVYIRKGLQDYSSITFLVVSSPFRAAATKKNGGTSNKSARFWVKLAETRNIQIADREVKTNES